jgi:hypothetical protein
VTQIDEVLHAIASHPSGITALDIHASTGVARNVLGTYLWELKKDGHIVRVGGVRGSFRYGITEKGKARIGLADPLTQLARAVKPRTGSLPPGFDETLKVIDRIDEYRTLKNFSQWLVSEHAELFVYPDEAAKALQSLTLEHMGVDPTTYQQQARALAGLLSLVKELE